MPALPGLFDSFDNLDAIKTEDIARWLKPQPQLTFIENYLAQRILYPQTVPITSQDMNLDLAILREAIRSSAHGDKKSIMLGDNPFINFTLRKILIPGKFLNFVKDLPTITWVFIDALLSERKEADFFEDLWTVVVTGETDEIVGSILLPKFKDKSSVIQLGVAEKVYKIGAGTLSVVPCSKQRCEITFKISSGKMLGKNQLTVEVYGGRLGLVIDGRKE